MDVWYTGAGGYRALANPLLIPVIIQAYGSEKYVAPSSQPILGFALAHMSYYLGYSRRTRAPKDRNTKFCLGSSFTKHWESVNHLGGSPCPIPPMPTRSWVPQAPGPVWKSGGSTRRPTIFYFNYTSDVLLFVFDWYYYDIIWRKMYLYETGDDKHTLCTVYFAVKQFCMSRVKRPHQCTLK